jgi:hypothetical protein
VTTILATCPTCGDLCLAPGDLSVRDDDGVSEYRFACHFCDRVVRKDADPALIVALLRVGVPYDRDVAYRRHPSYVPPITIAEVTAFCTRLDESDCFEELFDNDGWAA